MSVLKKYFSLADLALWTLSASVITAAFFVSGGDSTLALAASLVGITSIMINAKGLPPGPLLGVVFAGIYAYISWNCAYYGEFITYACMTGPMSAFSFVSWLRNPFKSGEAEVRVNSIDLPEAAFLCLLTAVVTVVFYCILRYFHTPNLLVSSFSVATSFAAVYLTFRRSAFFSLAYALNDIVLVILWTLASLGDSSYVSVAVCFATFLIIDIYGFINWERMKLRQAAEEERLR